jgi:antitoxin Phd
MSRRWPLQDARTQLDELVDQAVAKGPQTITRGGHPIAVVLSIAQFRRLIASQEDDLVTFFRKSPLAGAGLELDRDQDTGRDVRL